MPQWKPCCVGLWSGVQGEPLAPLLLSHPPLKSIPLPHGTPDQSKKGMFLVCWVCDLHFVFIVFTRLNLKTNRCAYTDKTQLSNVTCRSSDSCIHGIIHSAPFVGFALILQLYFLCRFLLVFPFSLYFNSDETLIIMYIIQLVVGKASSAAVFKSSVIFKKRETKWNDKTQNRLLSVPRPCACIKLWFPALIQHQTKQHTS